MLDYIIDLLSNPWVWIALAMFFLIIEVITTTVVSLWFAFGAFMTGFSMMVFGELPINTQLIIFSINTLISVPLIKYMNKKWFSNDESDIPLNDRSSILMHKEAFLIANTKNNQGQINIDGSIWRVLTNEPLRKGQRVKIVQSDSAELRVIPIKNDNTN